jgi:DNA replication protein DnaC
VRYALVVVLGYSRLLWVKFYPRQDMATLFAGLEDAFRHFGGVPRDVLFDQMRAVITRDLRLEGGTLVENAEFTRFAAHWGFTPRACRPYRAKTKGKVERPIRYLRENFLYGREFIGDADLNGQCEQWLLRVANVRLHQTIQARPLERFTNDEQHTLQSLPSSSYLSLVLRTGTRRTQSGMTPTPIQVAVERRSLHTYAQLAATIAARTGPDRTAVYPTRRWGCPMSTTKSGKAGAPARRDRIREYLAELKLPGSLEVLDAILSDLDGGRLSAAEAIERLLAAQITLRDERRLAIAMRSSRLPALKTLTEFDFGFQPSVKREQLDSLHELGFLERKENVIFLGPPGVGKTHLAISLVVQAARQGRRVYYSTLDDLIASLEQAQQQHKLVHRLRALTTPSVLLVDEIGYTPISQTGAMLFFQLMSRRYEHASTILTSNKGFEDWGHVFGDDVMATALIDRLVHHCHIVNITGNSYRTRNHAELLGGGGLHSHGDVRSSINGHRSPPTLRRRNRPPQGGMLTP